MKGSKMQNKCYECEYRGEVPGSAHSRCNHPALASADTPMNNILSIFAGVGRVPPHMMTKNPIGVTGEPHGIENGWFNFPCNFDPVWLNTCDGFTPKQEAKE